MATATSAVAIVAEAVMTALARIVIAGMATRAIRSIGRIAPGNRLAVADVAIFAAQTGPMVAGVIACMRVGFDR